ncbi:MAG: hypothetical protein AAF628_12830 [Planctomycetota bacterium]
MTRFAPLLASLTALALASAAAAQPCTTATVQYLYPDTETQQGCLPTGGGAVACPGRPASLGVNPLVVEQGSTLLAATLCTSDATPVMWIFGLQTGSFPLNGINVPSTGETCTLNLVPTLVVGAMSSPTVFGSITTLFVDPVPLGACGVNLYMQLAALEPDFNNVGISVSARADFVVGQ